MSVDITDALFRKKRPGLNLANMKLGETSVQNDHSDQVMDRVRSATNLALQLKCYEFFSDHDKPEQIRAHFAELIQRATTEDGPQFNMVQDEVLFAASVIDGTANNTAKKEYALMILKDASQGTQIVVNGETFTKTSLIGEIQKTNTVLEMGRSNTLATTLLKMVIRGELNLT